MYMALFAWGFLDLGSRLSGLSVLGSQNFLYYTITTNSQQAHVSIIAAVAITLTRMTLEEP
jgi:hypothetical protein